MHTLKITIDNVGNAAIEFQGSPVQMVRAIIALMASDSEFRDMIQVANEGFNAYEQQNNKNGDLDPVS
jgi:hypothetical protein